MSCVKIHGMRENFKLLKEQVAMICRIILEEGGDIDKLIGDAVNVSARIQKEAEKLPDSRCLYSESFVKGLPDASSFVMHGETALKGKAEKARLFRRA